MSLTSQDEGGHGCGDIDEYREAEEDQACHGDGGPDHPTSYCY